MSRSTPPPPWATANAAPHSDPFLHRHDTAAEQPPTRVQAAPGSDPAERRTADLRRRAIDRLVAMNINQAQAAWERRRRDPLEPHGIALLYVRPDPRAIPHGWRLCAATKLWLHDGHGWDVHHRLYRFYCDLAEATPLPGGDVRALSDRCDEDMADDAIYIGVAVSSLDTSTGAWRDVVATASVSTTDTRPLRLWGRTDTIATSRPAPPPRPMRVEDHRDIPGAIRIVLTDGTIIIGERRGRPDFDHKILHSTHTLDFGPYDSPYPWGWVSREQLDDDPDHGEVLRWLSALNELCWQTDTARLDTLRRNTHARGARP